MAAPTKPRKPRKRKGDSTPGGIQVPAPVIDGDRLVAAMRGHVEGQAVLPGMPEPEPRLPEWDVKFTGKARSVHWGRPLDPSALEANLGEEVPLYQEIVARVVSVRVEAASSDEARRVGERKVAALVGGMDELFAGYDGEPQDQLWNVKPAKEKG